MSENMANKEEDKESFKEKVTTQMEPWAWSIFKEG